MEHPRKTSNRTSTKSPESTSFWGCSEGISWVLFPTISPSCRDPKHSGKPGLGPPEHKDLVPGLGTKATALPQLKASYPAAPAPALPHRSRAGHCLAPALTCSLTALIRHRFSWKPCLQGSFSAGRVPDMPQHQHQDLQCQRGGRQGGPALALQPGLTLGALIYRSLSPE